MRPRSCCQKFDAVTNIESRVNRVRNPSPTPSPKKASPVFTSTGHRVTETRSARIFGSEDLQFEGRQYSDSKMTKAPVSVSPSFGCRSGRPEQRRGAWPVAVKSASVAAAALEPAIANRRGVHQRRRHRCECVRTGASSPDGSRLTVRECGLIPFAWNRFRGNRFRQMGRVHSMRGELQSSTRRKRVRAGWTGDGPLRGLVHRVVIPASASRWRPTPFVISVAGHGSAPFTTRAAEGSVFGAL